MVRRTMLVGVLVAPLLVVIPAGSSTPPVAAQAAEYIELSGDFSPDPGDEWISYGAGTASDWITVLHNGGVPGGNLTARTSRASCIGTGTYRPVVGNFDGTGYDEIFLYAPGASGDGMLYQNGSFCTTTPYTVGGDYQPIAGDFFGDGQDDVIWSTATQFVVWDHNGDDRWSYERPRQL